MEYDVPANNDVYFLRLHHSCYEKVRREETRGWSKRSVEGWDILNPSTEIFI